MSKTCTEVFNLGSEVSDWEVINEMLMNINQLPKLIKKPLQPPQIFRDEACQKGCDAITQFQSPLWLSAPEIHLLQQSG